MSSTPTRATIYEDTGTNCMARIVGDDSVAITQSDLSSISLSIFKNDVSPAETTATPVISDSVFDTLQTDARWSKDSTGYNFKYLIPSTGFSDGDSTYRAEFKFVPSTGSPFFVVYLIDTVEVLTS